MKLHWIDVTILVVYLLGIAVIGLLLKRKASKNLMATPSVADLATKARRELLENILPF